MSLHGSSFNDSILEDGNLPSSPPKKYDPLKHGSRVRGSLNISPGSRGNFSKEDIEFLALDAGDDDNFIPGFDFYKKSPFSSPTKALQTSPQRRLNELPIALSEPIPVSPSKGKAKRSLFEQ